MNLVDLKEGVLYIVNDEDNGGGFSKGSIITLDESGPFDIGTVDALFRLVEGKCWYNNARNGAKGAWVELDFIELYEGKETNSEQSPNQTPEQTTEELTEENLSLKKQIKSLEERLERKKGFFQSNSEEILKRTKEYTEL